MSSLANSVGTCSQVKLGSASTSLLSKTTYSETKSSTIKFPFDSLETSTPPLVLQQNENDNPIFFGRRQTMGFALCSVLLQALFEPQVSAAAEVVPCELTVASSGLAFCDKVVGTGPVAVEGQLIKAHYVGRLENGTVFDSSYNRGKPLTFRIGVGEVIKGWDKGILGGDGVPPMLAGGKRTIKLPPELGYGARGAGCRGGSCVIPPDSVLLFDVEFIGKA
ncbi:Peptidylprolyl isomerase [Quillaja saponaria]|uniref:peptidylprolyl isomerase n=1 Tax=Quillaja saponaria TaxID=32244 RepID=A0AAD7PWK0_QUISA|nr:Peptidylprolyl isomerase [Quillaja saponaria]